ncbi:MAG: PKD domain-containing protein [Actinomycetota bacterium]|nr:PKD domain-containing protein [Actinomycetota bacterium]
MRRQSYVYSLVCAPVRILLATLGVMVVAVAPAYGQAFTASPDPPVAGSPVVFTPVVTPLAPVLWSFGAGANPPGATSTVGTTTYAFGGVKTVTMNVTGSLPQSRQISVAANTPPAAQFAYYPTSPVVGQEVIFESFSVDAGGPISSTEWDFAYDGTFNVDATGTKPTAKFATRGTRTIALRVRDSASPAAQDIEIKPITIGPAPASPLPVAQFAVSPLRPRVGEQVSLRSFSYDPGGTIVSQRWDLDGDGDFEENFTGKTAFTVFPKAGERIVRLEVRDSDGGVQTETQNITVTPQPARSVSLINPFPVARLAGSVYPRGVRVRILEVRTPPRSRVVVRCLGNSCPDDKITKTSKRKPVRFKRMTRFLREGTILKVSIRKSGQIGKYTRWLIRGGKLPKRKDLCLYPGKSKGRRCPTVG